MHPTQQKSVWKVSGFDIDYPDEDIFVAYFTDRDTARAVYHRGEREYGMMVGYTKMRWTIEGFYLDNNPHIDQMFEDVCEAMEQ